MQHFASFTSADTPYDILKSIRYCKDISYYNQINEALYLTTLTGCVLITICLQGK